MTTTPEVWFLFLLAASLPTIVALAIAWRARFALRALWTRLETLQKDLWQSHYAHAAMRRQLYGEIGGLWLQRGSPLPFQAQDGEDILLWDYFQRRVTGVFVDVGAYDGLTFSNTHVFETLGWTGICIDANPHALEACRKNRPHSVVIHAAVGGPDANGSADFTLVTGDEGVEMLSFTESTPSHAARIAREGGHTQKITCPFRSLDNILESNAFNEIDILSIDIEGGDLKALQGCNLERYRPHAIVIESQSETTENYLASKGYRKLATTSVNAIYVRDTTQPAPEVHHFSGHITH